MSKPYIERRHIELEEEVELRWGEEGTSTWYARTYGPLVPTKETVQMSRSGYTAKEALDNLRAAIEAQGWELR